MACFTNRFFGLCAIFCLFIFAIQSTTASLSREEALLLSSFTSSSAASSSPPPSASSHFLSSAAFRSGPQISKLSPLAGPSIGGQTITVYGTDLDRLSDCECSFKSSDDTQPSIFFQTAAVLSGFDLLCVTQPVTLESQTYTILSITLDCATPMTIAGNLNFTLYQTPVFRAEDVPRYYYRTENETMNIDIQAVDLPSALSELQVVDLDCVTIFSDGLIKTADGYIRNASSILCPLTIDISEDSPSATLNITIDTVHFAAYTIHFSDPPSMMRFFPTAGPISGYSDITITGERFLDNGWASYDCIFGGGAAVSSGHWVDESTITCHVPQLHTCCPQDTSLVLSVNSGQYELNYLSEQQQSASFQYYFTPSIATISPTEGWDAGGQVVTVYGNNFPPAHNTTMQHEMRCLFDGKFSSAAIVYISKSEIHCVVPPGSNDDNGNGVLFTMEIDNVFYPHPPDITVITFYYKSKTAIILLATLVPIGCMLLIVSAASGYYLWRKQRLNNSNNYQPINGDKNNSAEEKQSLLSSDGNNSPNSGSTFSDDVLQRILQKTKSKVQMIPMSEIKLMQRIGVGSCGEVYRAKWRGSDVAVKKLSRFFVSAAASSQSGGSGNSGNNNSSGHSNNSSGHHHNILHASETIERNNSLLDEFVAEVSMLCNLRHPNIAAFIGCIIDPDMVAIVMELLSRGSLYKILQIGAGSEAPFSSAINDIINSFNHQNNNNSAMSSFSSSSSSSSSSSFSSSSSISSVATLSSFFPVSASTPSSSVPNNDLDQPDAALLSSYRSKRRRSYFIENNPATPAASAPAPTSPNGDNDEEAAVAATPDRSRTLLQNALMSQTPSRYGSLMANGPSASFLSSTPAAAHSHPHQHQHALVEGPGSSNGWYTLHRMLHMARDAAAGMHYLHTTAKLIHRDLKSPNLLVSSDWTIKVTDFGLSRFKDKMSNTATMTLNYVGSPLWMAPEVVLGKRYSEKVDVYSFGIILWEMFCIAVPYQGIPPFAALLKVAHEHLRPPIPEHCPAPLSELMRACWSANPDVRPSFEQVLEEIDAMMQDHGLMRMQVVPCRYLEDSNVMTIVS